MHWQVWLGGNLVPSSYQGQMVILSRKKKRDLKNNEGWQLIIKQSRLSKGKLGQAPLSPVYIVASSLSKISYLILAPQRKTLMINDSREISPSKPQLKKCAFGNAEMIYRLKYFVTLLAVCAFGSTFNQSTFKRL